MTDNNLYKGIAIVIDEKIGERKDRINEIIKIIKSKNIPCLEYKEIPSNEIINNWRSISFIILDWQLVDPPEGVKSGELTSENIKENIKFLKQVKESCFAPVFIFSNLSKEDIEDEIIGESEGGPLYNKESEEKNFILIRQKGDLIKGDKLFEEIGQWIKKNPAIYTQKIWENAFLKAKTESFWYLFKECTIWPKALWKTFNKESVDESSNILDIVYQFIKTRTDLAALDEKIVKPKEKESLSPEEIASVIQSVMYLPGDKIKDNDLQPGDIFKIGKKLYMNIRPACDTVVNRKNLNGSSAFDNQIYLLKGEECGGSNLKDVYKEKYGFLPRPTFVILYDFKEDKCIKYSFKNLKILEFSKSKEKRVARLLPPYINFVQQQYSAHIGRVGIPRVPHELIEQILKEPKK